MHLWITSQWLLKYFSNLWLHQEEKEWKYLDGENVPYVIIADNAKGMDIDTQTGQWGEDIPIQTRGNFGIMGLLKNQPSNA